MRYVLALLLMSSAAFAQEGTIERPLHLTCETFKQIIARAVRAKEADLVSGDMTVVAQDAKQVPPVLLGCPGESHIVCLTETAVEGATGTRVGITGRIAGVGRNYVSVDPCGVSRAR